MSYLRIAKWDKHQHYKDRNPPWIKFYVELIEPNHKMNDLPVATRFLWDRLLLLAAKCDNSVPNDPELIARLLRMPPRQCREGIQQLVKGRWLQETSTKRRASKRASDIAPPEVRSKKLEESPISPLDFKCGECGIVKVNVKQLEEHLEIVHGVEPAPVVPLREREAS